MRSRSRLTLVFWGIALLLLVGALFRGKMYLENVSFYLLAGKGVAPVGDIVLVRCYGSPFLSEFNTAVKLAREGKAAHILVALHKPLEYQKLVGDDLENQDVVIASFFQRNGIPTTSYSIVHVETREPVLIHEVRALRPVLSQLSATRSWHRVILIGRQYRMRRVLWSFQTFARDRSFKFIPYNLSFGDAGERPWWKNHDAASEVFSEYFKLIYFQIYRLRSQDDLSAPESLNWGAMK